MTAEDFIESLTKVELFQGLSRLQLGRIAESSERAVFQDGEPIIEDGAAGDAAFLIFTGDVERQGSGGIEPQSEGLLLGEMAMLIETEHSITVFARGRVRALRIPREGLLALMVEDSTLADHFVDKLAARLKAITGEFRRIDAMLDGTSDESSAWARATPQAHQLLPVG